MLSISMACGPYRNGVGESNRYWIDSSGTQGSASTAGSNGGGVSNRDVLTMTNSTVAHNRLSNTYSYGGGIYNTGTAKLVRVTINDNEAMVTAGAGGGIGMWGVGAVLHVVDSIAV